MNALALLSAAANARKEHIMITIRIDLLTSPPGVK